MVEVNQVVTICCLNFITFLQLLYGSKNFIICLKAICVWIVKVSIKGNIKFLKVDFNNYYQTLPKYITSVKLKENSL